MKTKCVLIGLVVLWAFGLGYGQVRTGVLTGRVSDDRGESLPGVAITITGPAIIEGRIAGVTNEHGLYRFINLPPGVYAVKAELQGFSTTEQTEIRVRLGLTTTIDIQLKPGEIKTEIQVVAATPPVDVESTKLSTNFTTEMLTKLPSTRNLEAFFKLAPGMVVDFGADPKYPERSAFGSGSRENYYSVDGTYLTDPGAGTQMIYWNYDIIEEAQVETTGHEAQYGNSAGAVINVVTKSGGDQFHGVTNLYYRDRNMASANNEGTGLPGPTNAIKREWEGSLNLGGPIVREKVWFFLSGGFIPTLSDTTGFPADINRKQYFGFGKVTTQLGTKNKLSMMYNYSRDTLNHMFASQFRTPQSTLNSRQWTSAFNLQWNSMISADALLETRGAYVDRATTYISNGPGPCYYDLDTGMMTGSAGFHNEQTRKRYQFQVACSYWLTGLAGDHDLKTGIDYEQGESGYDGTSQTDTPGGPSFIYTSGGEVLMYEVDDPAHTVQRNIFRGLAFYAQDTWKVGKRVNLNIGARLNQVRSLIPVQNLVSSPITEYSFTNFEPRLGVVFDISSKSRQMALKANYGRYYMNSMALGLLNPNAQTYYTYFVSGGVPILIDVTGPTAISIDPDLKRPYSDTYILGFETAVTKHLAFKVNGIYKRSKNFIGTYDLNKTADWYDPVEVTNPITNEPMTVYNLRDGAPTASLPFYTNPPQADRKYKGLQFILEQGLYNHFQFILSYTLSKANGTVPLGTWGSGGMTASGTWNNPNMFVNTSGLLDLDKTHDVKFSGVWLAPYGFVLGVNYIGQSGAPYARFFNVELNQGIMSFNAETPGAKRTPFQHMIDVRLEKSFLVGRIKPSVFFEAFNLLNSNTAIGIGAQVDSPTFNQITAILPPRIFRVGVALTF